MQQYRDYRCRPPCLASSFRIYSMGMCVHILQLTRTIGPQHSLFANVFCQLQSTRQMFSSLSKSRRQWGSKLLSLTTSECPSWPCRFSQSVRPPYSICLMLGSLVLKAHRVTPLLRRAGSILPLVQEPNLELILHSSFSHTPCPGTQHIPLASFSKTASTV